MTVWRRFVPTLLLLAAIVGWRGTIIGDLGLADSVLALRHSGRAFHSALWQAKDPNARDQMVADLARGHQLTGVNTSAITSLLGPSECYVNYDDEPCYEFAFDGAKHRLEFSVNHSDQPGRVIDVSIEKSRALDGLR